MNDKIIQIQAFAGNGEHDGMLYALCADGSIYAMVTSGQRNKLTGEWMRLPAIPREPKP